MRSTTKGIWRLLNGVGNPIKRFSDEKQKTTISSFIRSAWNQTFPKQQDQVKIKYQKAKQAKRFTKEQIQQMQLGIHQYKRTALVETEDKGKQETKKFTLASVIPQSIKKKITQSPTYKEYTDFKENLKQYASTRDGKIADAGSYVYGMVATGSSLAKATQIMRKYDPEFTIFSLQKESSVIFKDAYTKLMNFDIQEIEKLSSQQALQYFKAYIKMNKVKNQRPKYLQLVHSYPADLRGAKIGQKLLPTFNFQIKTMEIYCMINAKDEIVDGDDERIIESIFQFSICYAGNHIDSLGHPWEITEIRKIQQLKLLV